MDTRFTDQRAADFIYKRQDQNQADYIRRRPAEGHALRYGKCSCICSLGVAAEEIYTDFDKKIAHMYELRDHFIESVQRIDGVSVNGRTDHTNAPHVVSVSVDGVRAEVMLHTLEDRQIYVSAGSACSSNKPAISSTLKSIGLKPSLLDSTIRFSFCVNTTQEEIDYAVSVMAEVIPMLRRYTRR